MTLIPGTKAPSFSLTSHEGKKVSLKDFNGKNVIVYFYPRDNTPGCTTEACDFRDNLMEFKKLNYEIIGISPDSVASHQKFLEKFSLPFTLLSDPDHLVAETWGVWGPKKMYGKDSEGIIRTTVLLDKKGVVRAVFANVKATGHVERLLAALPEV